MRVLSVSDLHYRLPHYDWLVKAAADHDVVVLAGDLADVVSPVPIDVQSVVLGTYLSRLAGEAVVLASSGHHDLDGPGANGEQVAGWMQRTLDDRVHVDGSSTDVDGVRVTVCPWWDGPLTRAEVDAQLEAAAVDRPATWVWAYHSPPADTPLCNDGRREFPDHELAAWIEQHQPDIVLCGHIHQAPWARGGSWRACLGRTWVGPTDLGCRGRAGAAPVPRRRGAGAARIDRSQWPPSAGRTMAERWPQRSLSDR